MWRLCNIDGKYYMHMVTGDAITPRKREKAGWTQPAPQLPGLEILLDDVEGFAQKVMCQHYIISYGDNTEIIKELCSIFGITLIKKSPAIIESLSSFYRIDFFIL